VPGVQRCFIQGTVCRVIDILNGCRIPEPCLCYQVLDVLVVARFPFLVVKELLNFKELFLKSQRHEKAEVIRRYVQELEYSALQRNELTEDLKKEIEWARKKADWYDPFIESLDELLNEVDREELVIKKQSFYLLERS